MYRHGRGQRIPCRARCVDCSIECERATIANGIRPQFGHVGADDPTSHEHPPVTRGDMHIQVDARQESRAFDQRATVRHVHHGELQSRPQPHMA